MTKTDTNNMPFLTETDYQVQVRNWIKNIISQNSIEVLQKAELAAQQEMETYLRSQYDVGQIFDVNQAKTNRSQLIVMYMVDITLYHLYSNIAPNDIPELRQTRYDNAMLWLKKVNESDLSPKLPLIKNEDDPEDEDSLSFQGTSNPSYTHRF